jgi:cation transporter-like permease
MAWLGWAHGRVALAMYSAAVLFGACAFAISRLPDRTGAGLVLASVIVLGVGLVALLRLDQGMLADAAVEVGASPDPVAGPLADTMT